MLPISSPKVLDPALVPKPSFPSSDILVHLRSPLSRLQPLSELEH